MLNKFPSEKLNGTKNALFSFRGIQLITVLLLIGYFYISCSTRFISLKVCVGFSILNSVPFYKVYVFVQQNAWTL